MASVYALALFGAAVLVLAFLWARRVRQRRIRDRLMDEPGPAADSAAAAADREPPPGRPYVRRYYWAPWLAGLLAAAVVYFLLRWGWAFALTFGVVTALLGWRLEIWLAERRRVLIQVQLANALDLMIATLRAGAGLQTAIEAAARESKAPLRPQLDNVLGRIRYGDDPQAVIRALETRVPLETFRLFCEALLVHWEVGGSLAPVLATVARSIRDRIELMRRIQSMSTETRVSIVAVLLVTYFIAAVVWRNDPKRMEDFLATTLGQGLVVAGMILQALGILWTSWLSRARY